jgi:hypothetical protein
VHADRVPHRRRRLEPRDHRRALEVVLRSQSAPSAAALLGMLCSNFIGPRLFVISAPGAALWSPTGSPSREQCDCVGPQGR